MTKTILDEFERRTIEVRGENDRIETRALWCYGEIYVAPCKVDREPMWQLGCIPLGLCFPQDIVGFYETIEDACGAAKELSRVNNCWALVPDFGPEEYAKLTTIAEKYNGKRIETREMKSGEIKARTVNPNLNGASYDQARN